MNTPTCAASSTRSKRRRSSSSFARSQLAKSSDEKKSALTLTLNLTTFYRTEDGPTIEIGNEREWQAGLEAADAVAGGSRRRPGRAAGVPGAADDDGRRSAGRGERGGVTRAAAPAARARPEGTQLGPVEDVRLAKLEQEWPAPGRQPPESVYDGARAATAVRGGRARRRNRSTTSRRLRRCRPDRRHRRRFRPSR